MNMKVLRFSNILFLDAQKRSYNHVGWPYSGITIIDGNNKTGVCCEGIISSEDLEIYEWMLRSMCEMEPQFRLSNIKLIFADQFIKQSLLNNLGISSTCTL